MLCEPVQYFQFDKDGNTVCMYMNRSGSGFSGEAKLIEPGFEWSKLPSTSEMANIHYDSVAQYLNVKIEQKSEESLVMEYVPSKRYCL